MFGKRLQCLFSRYHIEEFDQPQVSLSLGQYFTANYHRYVGINTKVCALQFRIMSLREHGPASPNPAHVDILSIEKLIHFEAWENTLTTALVL